MVNVLSVRLNGIISILQNFLTRYEKVILWSLGILYKLALDAMYLFAASPQYQIAGLVCDFVLWKYFLATVMYLTIFAALPKKEKDTVNFLFHLQFVFTVAPMLTFYGMSNSSTAYMFAVFACTMLQALLIRVPTKSSRTIFIKGIGKYVVAVFTMMAVYSAVSMILQNGFDGFKVFDLSYIYEMRANLEYPLVVGYFVNWLTKAGIPFALLFGLERKKYWLSGLCVVLQTLFFMLTGEKVVLLILIPIVLIYYCAKTGHLLKLMYLGLTAVSVVVTLAWQIGRNIGWPLGITLCSLYAVRAIFHPADNKFDFYECFSHLPKTYFSDGQIGRMLGLTYPYQGSLGQVVHAWRGGEFLLVNMNTGYLGEAYAQCGYLGMMIMSLLLAFVIRFLRRYDGCGNYCLLVALFSVYFIVLNDGALFTTMFTGGLLIAYMLVFVFLSKRAEGTKYGI